MNLPFHFQYPWVLLGLLLPFLLGRSLWRGAGLRIAVPFDHGRRPASRGWKWSLDVAQSLPSVMLACALILLAGPQRMMEPQSKRALTNIEFCVDVSGSMTSPFGGGNRYEGAMSAINSFLDFRKGDAFGLTFFGNAVLHWVPLTSDVSAIRQAPPFMRPERMPPAFGGTEIGKALLACREVLLTRQEGDRMIVLVTDGISADLGGDREVEIARRLSEDKITLYAIHIDESPVPEEILSIAHATGGEVFNPDDPAGLTTVFRKIDRMQQTRIEQVAADAVDDFFLTSVIGLSCALLSTICSLGLRYAPW